MISKMGSQWKGVGGRLIFCSYTATLLSKSKIEPNSLAVENLLCITQSSQSPFNFTKQRKKLNQQDQKDNLKVRCGGGNNEEEKLPAVAISPSHELSFPSSARYKTDFSGGVIVSLDKIQNLVWLEFAWWMIYCN